MYHAAPLGADPHAARSMPAAQNTDYQQ